MNWGNCFLDHGVLGRMQLYLPVTQCRSSPNPFRSKNEIVFTLLRHLSGVWRSLTQCSIIQYASGVPQTSITPTLSFYQLTRHSFGRHDKIASNELSTCLGGRPVHMRPLAPTARWCPTKPVANSTEQQMPLASHHAHC